MPPPQMPWIRIMKALKAFCAATLAAAELEAAVRVRHLRHRSPDRAWWPCVSLEFASNDPADTGVQQSAFGDDIIVMELRVLLVIDTALPAELDDHSYPDTPPPGAGVQPIEDETGFETAGEIMAVLLRALHDNGYGSEPVTLGGLVHEIVYDGSEDLPDDDRQPDQMRMVEGLTLVYRVRRDDPTHLLTGED